MRGDREHAVVVLGRHQVDGRARELPQRPHPLDRQRIGVLDRGQDAAAALEQGGERRVRPGMLGAGHRMAGHEQAGRGQMRDHVAHDLRLDRADVGDDRVRGQARAAWPRPTAPTAAGGTPRTTRSAPAHGLGRVGFGAVAQAELARTGAGALLPRPGDDLAGRRLAPQHGGERAVDQADAQHRHAAKRGHACGRPATKPLSASTSRRFSSSSPMLIRRQSGRP